MIKIFFYVSCVLLFACSRTPEYLKGYKQVAETKYWYLDDSIKVTNNSLVFKGVAVLDNGYIRFIGETDCESIVLIQSGVEFDSHDAVVTEVKREQIQEKDKVNALIKSICSPSKEKTVEGELGIKDAMLVIFKGTINEKGESRRIGIVDIPNDIIKDSDWERLNRRNLLVRPLELISFVENNNQKKMLLTATEPNENEVGHNSQVILSAYIFEKKGKDWSLMSDFPFVASFGVFGTVHSVSKLKIGENKEGILLEAMDMGQGYNGGITSFFAVVNGKPSKVLEADTSESYDNSSVCYENPSCPVASYAYNTKTTAILGKNKEWYDIILSQDGTNEVNDKVVPHKKQLKFVFNGQVYKGQ